MIYLKKQRLQLSDSLRIIVWLKIKIKYSERNGRDKEMARKLL